MPEIVLRPATEGDLADLSALFRAVYGRERSPEHYRWKYFLPQPPYTGARFWVAEVGERIVGCAGMMTYPFWLEGQEHLGVSTCEYHILPEVRRQGVQTRLEAAMFDALEGHNPLFGLCLPNQSLAPFAISRGYLAQFRLVWMRQRASWWSLLRRPLPAGRTVRTLASPGAACDALWLRLRDKVDACLRLSAHWVHVRYETCPTFQYTYLVAEDAEGPTAFLVLGKKWIGKRQEAVIAYYLAAPGDEDSFVALLHGALRAARSQGLRYLRALVPEAHVGRWGWWGFREAPGEYVLHVHPMQNAEVPAALCSPDRYAVHLGDQDFI